MVDSRDTDILQMLDQRVGLMQHARPERLAQEEMWLTSMAYFSGQQRFKIEGGRMYNAPYFDEEEIHYKVNLVRAKIITATAKILNVHADFDVRPTTGNAHDRELADLSKKVFRHIRDITDFERARVEAVMWKAICGTAFYKCSWDPTQGEPDRFYWNDDVNKDVIPSALLTPEQIQRKELLGWFEDLPPGDLGLSVLSPFLFFHDWTAKGSSLRNAHWCAEKHYIDIDRIAERFGVDEKDIKPVEMAQGLTNYEDAMAFMSTDSWFGPFNFAIPKDKLRKRTLYVEMWQRPDSKNKKGLRIVYAGGLILNAGNTDNPHIGDRTGWSLLPYVPEPWVPHPGRFMGCSLVEDLLTPQFYLNEERSSKLMFMRTYGLPNTYVGADSGLDTDNMEAGGGRIYQVRETSAFKVQHGPIPQMPPDVAQIGALVEADLSKCASQTEIQEKSLPGQLRSGTAIQAINEDRYIGLSIPALMNVRAARDCGRMLLAIAKLFYGDKRVMRYLGEGNEWIVQEFNGSDLVNDVVVLGNPSVTDTLANQRESMLDAIQAGAFNPQFDKMTRALILSGLNYNTSDEFVRANLAPKRSQEFEIQEIVNNPGKYPNGYPVMPWQDHEIEMGTLRMFMYSPEFRQLDPLTQSVLSAHYQAHQQYYQQAQAEQIRMLAETKGAPGPQGQASQPAS